MAKFFVGKRVRIKWSVSWPELAGQEGVIAGYDPHVHHVTGRCIEWDIAPDAWGSKIASRPGVHGGSYFCASSEQIEPITDRNEVVTWESCAWSPHRAGVVL